MAKRFPGIDARLAAFIACQRIFFTASAAEGARVNVSPRGTEALRILDPTTAAYLDLTGSGNETAAHLLADGRLTLMFCAFEGAPMILRLYGRARVLRRGSAPYADLLASAFGGAEPPGARQIVRLAIDLVQTSRGYGVPLFDFAGQRAGLTRWAETQGEAGLDAYRRANNQVSMDGLPTGLPEDEAVGSSAGDGPDTRGSNRHFGVFADRLKVGDEFFEPLSEEVFQNWGA